MSRCAAFLRGLNLGGQRRVSNAELVAAFEALGFSDVRTFRASGNVTFTLPRAADDEALRRRIEAGLGATLGYPVPTFVRAETEVLEIAARRPFPARAVRASAGKLHVALLSGAPSRSTRAEVLGMADERDLLAFGERELYWLPAGRMIESGLDLPRIERLVGPWTMRTKATVEQLAARHLAS